MEEIFPAPPPSAFSVVDQKKDGAENFAASRLGKLYIGMVLFCVLL